MHEMRGSLFFCFCLFFNGRLNSQIWHHKAKAPKSHPEGWCGLDCGRFRRGFNSFSFSITMPKKKKTRWNSARCKVYSISHFFSFASSIRRTQEEKKKPCYFFFFSFFFYLKNMVQREGGQRLGNTASSKKISNNKQKQRRKKKIQAK